MSGASFKKSARNLANRRKSCEERLLIDLRYGLSRGLLYKLSRLLNFSVVDVLVAVVRTMKLRGKDARQI